MKRALKPMDVTLGELDTYASPDGERWKDGGALVSTGNAFAGVHEQINIRKMVAGAASSATNTRRVTKQTAAGQNPGTIHGLSNRPGGSVPAVDVFNGNWATMNKKKKKAKA